MARRFTEATIPAGHSLEFYLGISVRPPYPQDAQIGRLLHNLSNVPEYMHPNNLDRECSQTVVNEMTLAIFWLIRLKWQSKFKFPKSFLQRFEAKPKAIETALKPAGEWLKALLQLCMETAVIAHRKDSNVPADAAGWLCAIVLEVAAIGGIHRALLGYYEPEGEIGKCSKRNLARETNKIVGRINGKERPATTARPFGMLLDVSIVSPEQNDLFRRGPFSDFIKATRNYLKAMTKEPYSTIYIADDIVRGKVVGQSLYRNLDNGGRKQKIISETLAA